MKAFGIAADTQSFSASKNTAFPAKMAAFSSIRQQAGPTGERHDGQECFLLLFWTLDAPSSAVQEFNAQQMNKMGKVLGIPRYMSMCGLLEFSYFSCSYNYHCQPKFGQENVHLSSTVCCYCEAPDRLQREVWMDRREVLQCGFGVAEGIHYLA